MLTIPYDGKNLKALENLIASSDAHFETSTALSVLPQHITPESYVPRLYTAREDHDVIPSMGLAMLDQRSDDTVNILLRILLTKLPKNSLKSFKYVQN